MITISGKFSLTGKGIISNFEITPPNILNASFSSVTPGFASVDSPVTLETVTVDSEISAIQSSVSSVMNPTIIQVIDSSFGSTTSTMASIGQPDLDQLYQDSSFGATVPNVGNVGNPMVVQVIDSSFGSTTSAVTSIGQPNLDQLYQDSSFGATVPNVGNVGNPMVVQVIDSSFENLINNFSNLSAVDIENASPSDELEWMQISAGSFHSLAIDFNGQLWSWGSNSHGQLGLNDLINRNFPEKINNDSDWLHVSAGALHSFAIKSDGTLWAWGSNLNGRLGLGGITDNRLIPTRVGTASDWLAISAGNIHSLGIRAPGNLWGWGNGANGRLGTGSITGNNTFPIRIGSETDWQVVSAGINHSLGIRGLETRKLWGWGDNGNGQVGSGGIGNNVLSPNLIGNFDDWQSISAGETHSIGIRSGTLWIWGNDDTSGSSLPVDGKLGLGEYNDPLFGSIAPIPTQIIGFDDWVFASAGWFHSLAVRINGELYSWGRNLSGQLGLDDLSNRNIPNLIGNQNDWNLISAGRVHSLAIKNNKTLWAWGSNSSGQAGGSNIFQIPNQLVL